MGFNDRHFVGVMTDIAARTEIEGGTHATPINGVKFESEEHEGMEAHEMPRFDSGWSKSVNVHWNRQTPKFGAGRKHILTPKSRRSRNGLRSDRTGPADVERFGTLFAPQESMRFDSHASPEPSTSGAGEPPSPSLSYSDASRPSSRGGQENDAA